MFRKYKISDVFQHEKQENNLRELIAVDSDKTSIEESLEILGRHQISSLPLYTTTIAEITGKQNRKYHSIVDNLDIVYHLAFKSKSLESTIGQVEGSQIKTLHFEDDLESALYAFSTGSHRALVSPETKSETDRMSIITQSDVIRFILNMMKQRLVDDDDKLKKMMDESIGTAVETWTRHPLTIHDSTIALTGFKKISIHKVHALGIIDTKGRLVGELSVSDLKPISHLTTTTKDLIEILQLSVLLFLSKVHDGNVPDPIIVHLNVSLIEVMQKMIRFHVHRVWIVDDDDELLGLVTMTDIIRQVLDHVSSKVE